MFFQRLKTPGLGHNSYVVGCGEGLAVVIDPRRDVDEYLDLTRENNLTIVYILETHRQEDFEFGSATLAEMTGAKIVSGCHELFGDTDIKLKDGEELEVGTTRFVVLETPGHTPESVTYAVYVEGAGDKCWGVFTGDTLFVGDTGRTDLTDPEKTRENAGILYDSVHARIAPLGDQALLYPAHGAGSACGGNISDRDDSTLGIEKGTNPVFEKSRSEFADHKFAEKMARPPHFRHMEEVNLLPGRPLPSPAKFRVLQPREFQQRMQEGLVIDTRSPEAFAGAHIASSYNVWLDGLPAIGSWVANGSSRIFLVVDSPEDIDTAVKSLARIGIDSVEGVLLSGVEAWREQGLPIETLATTSAHEVAGWNEQERVQIVDVRDEYEWNEKHIPGAIHHFVGDLEKNLPQLPKDSEIVVHCSVGHRSGVAASILKRNGFERVHNMLGGITAWEKLDLPLEKSDKAKT
ncbi:MBL fold metallo-hydrolase [Haliea sp. E1-2-M8]|uniref:MBL fold metallo-hydrolase n=1 Tax=Haliea sp. E1-2-M8 TaxID=3064706 RepID=UPI002719BFAC|nr:MBL fold metallo-hydrolase [Haliea sp. E1-2-M8]MDO8861639.1 MBL fold metallo-hydrolase [Haliea sp. E1-2-M8]